MFNVIEEGKKEAIQLLDKTFGSDTRLKNEILNIDETPSKGDIPFIIKFYKEENSDFNHIKEYFKKYYSFKRRNVPVKAPNNFKDFIEWTEHLDNVEALQSMKNSTNKNVEFDQNDENDENKIAEDSDLIIYRGDSQDRCIKYGKGYTFCVSRVHGGNMYDSYRLTNESSFYFIFFKKIPKTNPEHILVLDKTKTGWQWTFANNATKNTTWESIINKFPVLEKYKNLFVQNPLTDTEKEKIKFIREFRQRQDLDLFVSAPREFQIVVLKSGITLTDQIYSYLEQHKLWEMINEYVSIGTNISQLQADSIEKKGGSILKNYLKSRELSIPDLEIRKIYRFNKLDKQIEYVQKSIEYTKNEVLKLIKKNRRNKINEFIFDNIPFLIELPDNFPEKVYKLVINNCNLSSLKNCPRYVTRTFDCNSNLLTSLEGGPESVGEHYHCKDNKLTSLKGVPENIGGQFDCSFNTDLKSLEGGPKTVKYHYICSRCGLTSLKGVPKEIGTKDKGGGFSCLNNFLTSLKDGPKIVHGHYNCDDNRLTSLEGAPEIVGKNFNCAHNFLTSLKGAPKTVGWDFNCYNNHLSSLEGSPKTVGGRFSCMNNPLVSLKGISIVNPFMVSANSNEKKFTHEEIVQAIEDSKKQNSLKAESFKFYFYNR